MSCFLTFCLISVRISRHRHGQEGLDLLRIKYEYCDNNLGQPYCADFSPAIHYFVEIFIFSASRLKILYLYFLREHFDLNWARMKDARRTKTPSCVNRMTHYNLMTLHHGKISCRDTINSTLHKLCKPCFLLLGVFTIGENDDCR